MPSDDQKKSPSKFARLSGIGLQMGATIFLGAYLGKYLDEKYPSGKRWFTIGLTLFSVALALYFVLKQVNRINNEDE
jgi:F0F1-type ATP synthase assembly protein I